MKRLDRCSRASSSVMAGLDPAIQADNSNACLEALDSRLKGGHDNEQMPGGSLMPVIASLISPQSETFKANAAQLLGQVEKFRAIERAVITHSSQQAEKFEKRGQLLPRERVARLLDRGSPFLELCTLAGFGMHDDDGGARSWEVAASSASASWPASAAWFWPATARSRAAPSRRWA